MFEKVPKDDIQVRDCSEFYQICGICGIFQIMRDLIAEKMNLPLGNAKTNDQKKAIFKANKMFQVCLFLPILFHEVQAIRLSIAHRVYQTLTQWWVLLL